MVRRTDLDDDVQDVITAILRSPSAVMLQESSEEQTHEEDTEVVNMSMEDVRAEIDSYNNPDEASPDVMEIPGDAVVTSMSLDEFRTEFNAYLTTEP